MASRKLYTSVLILGLVGLGLMWGTTRTNAARISGNNDAKNEITFNKDVAPILYRNCAECHRAGDIAPMSLITYKEARPWARSIREKVATRQMPPWGADSAPGQFTNDRRLSQAEMDTVMSWVDQGAKEGDPKDLPPEPDFAHNDGFLSGTPDVVLSMDKDFTIPAGGPDEYIYFTIPTNFTEDKWVRAAEIKPGNKKVVHHIIAFVETPEQAAAMKNGFRPPRESDRSSIFYKDGTLSLVKMDAPVEDDGAKSANEGSAFGNNSRGNGGLGALLAGYAPGKDRETYPAGSAMKIPAGSFIVFQVHYSNFRGALNTTETDRSSIGLYFAKASDVTKVVQTRAVSNHYFLIPPGDPDHKVTAAMTFNQDTKIISYMPHMHLRGKDMRYDLVYPDGKTETLLNVPAFSFNWQTVYKLPEPKLVPKGSRLVVTAHFDNSERNKFNPDPTKAVRWGDPTYTEMMIGWFTCEVPRPKDRVVAKIDPAVYDRYVGDYQFLPGVVLKITRQGDRLLGQLTGQPQVEFFAESETKFFLKVIDGELTFVKDAKGEVNELQFDMGDRQMHGKRIIPAAKAN
ncbi:MAG TPA: DUF3471 domain-containing protein [Blastocatellia bacterium]|nr:DUF3471 domain-containing protein [Blastocatellia bacterium]